MATGSTVSTTLPASAAGSASASPLPLNRKKYAPAPMASTATSAMISSFFLPPFAPSSSSGVSFLVLLLTSPPRRRSSGGFALLLCSSVHARGRSRVAPLGGGGLLRGGLDARQECVRLGRGGGQDDDVDPPVHGDVAGVGVRDQRPGAPVAG